jgi:hypothetical protein
MAALLMEMLGLLVIGCGAGLIGWWVIACASRITGRKAL